MRQDDAFERQVIWSPKPSASHERSSEVKPQPRDRDYYYYAIMPALNKLSNGAKLTDVARGKVKLTIVAHGKDSRVHHERRLSSGAKLTAVERGQDPSQASEVITNRGKPNGLPFGPSRTASATACRTDCG